MANPDGRDHADARDDDFPQWHIPRCHDWIADDRGLNPWREHRELAKGASCERPTGGGVPGTRGASRTAGRQPAERRIHGGAIPSDIVVCARKFLKADGPPPSASSVLLRF